jgi:hypothetical protein
MVMICRSVQLLVAKVRKPRANSRQRPQSIAIPDDLDVDPSRLIQPDFQVSILIPADTRQTFLRL